MSGLIRPQHQTVVVGTLISSISSLGERSIFLDAGLGYAVYVSNGRAPLVHRVQKLASPRALLAFVASKAGGIGYMPQQGLPPSDVKVAARVAGGSAEAP